MTTRLLVEGSVVEEAVGELVQWYVAMFRPAIAAQAGFIGVEFIRYDGSDKWLLIIRFEREEDRLSWVATELHEKVWGRMSELFRVTCTQVGKVVE